MRTLPLRPEGAKKPASISSKESPALGLINASLPEFEPPDPSFLPPDDVPDEFSAFPEPSERHIPPLFQNASRRVMHCHRFRLTSCQYEAILLVALNRNCLEVGHALLAQGGVSPANVSFPLLLSKAQALEAAGIILLQNRPGRVSTAPPINPLITIEIALFCEWAGIPLIEHIYVNRKGEPLFVRERGILKDVPQGLSTLREWSNEIAKKEVDRGICSLDYYDRKKALAAEELPVTIEILTHRRR
jgi:hypothetical protein